MVCLDWPFSRFTVRTTESYPLPTVVNTSKQPVRRIVAALAISSAFALVSGCSSEGSDAPATIAPAQAAVSPPVAGRPDGVVRPLVADANAAVVDTASGSLVVLAALPVVTVLSRNGGDAATVPLSSPATALTGDGDGHVYAATRGGYHRIDLAGRTATKIEVEGLPDTEFTAIARRADGRLVLGSADGAVYTLGSDTAVAAELKIFARVDALVTQGNTTVVLDRAQTSVTALTENGEEQAQALRAGEGATTMVADPVGRVLVADTRGEGLLVFGTDPLILRQRYPVRGAPYGLAVSSTLAWVSQTAANEVVGYDLATGIPVEKVRYRTVQQPNSLAFDESSGTLYVVSGSGAGVQVIVDAAKAHA
ncbi:SMP-30/gluconolaconase/LRE domain-containing protein [Mycolicibacterium novocastrense]|uniref:SMP-30/gluconolaconase/LRE domain-containing protein n=1 Tax=Mycolicibacterium novocastrense TaxID=59813 RepID=A0ABQ0KJS9_MYCNV|nr:SMP-30/gluconolaconase/LRE domain-containing protein [Mycolicibacterium novocastrense]